MPWADLTYERLLTVYADLFNDLVVNKTNRELSLTEVMIRVEVLRRDFTKRQLTILSFIFTFSHFYGKQSALVPKLSDFELAGIHKTKIVSELTNLMELDIITWHRGKDYNELSIKDPREWKAPYHKMYSDKRAQELLFLNLKHAEVPFDLDELKKKVKLIENYWESKR